MSLNTLKEDLAKVLMHVIPAENNKERLAKYKGLMAMSLDEIVQIAEDMAVKTEFHIDIENEQISNLQNLRARHFVTHGKFERKNGKFSYTGATIPEKIAYVYVWTVKESKDADPKLLYTGRTSQSINARMRNHANGLNTEHHTNPNWKFIKTNINELYDRGLEVEVFVRPIDSHVTSELVELRCITDLKTPWNSENYHLRG